MGKAGRGPRESKTGVRNIAARHLDAEALELRKSGRAYPEIAQALGISVSGAYKCVTRAMRAIIEEPAREVLRLEVERLDALLAGVWPKAIQGDATAVGRALDIMTRRARLLGLDAPTKVAPTNPDGTEAYNPYMAMTDDQLREVARRIIEQGGQG